MKLKLIGFRGEGKLVFCIPRNLARKLVIPQYFVGEVDTKLLIKREKYRHGN